MLSMIHGGKCRSRLDSKTRGLLRAGKTRKEHLRCVVRCLLDLHSAARDLPMGIVGEVMCRAPCRSDNAATARSRCEDGG